MTLDLSASNRIKSEAVATIGKIADVAGRLDLKDSEADIRGQARQLADDTFRIIVAGRFKNGKSTLLNALLGNPAHPVAGLPTGKGPMPAKDLPTTAVLTIVSYSEKPFVRKIGIDGSVEEWTFERYLEEARVKPSSAENEAFFRSIREFQVGFPADICRQGVVILDSPGTDDVSERTALTNAAARSCDLAIVVFRSDALVGAGEWKFLEQVLDGTKNFLVVNLFNGRRADEEFKQFTWNRIVNYSRKGPAYSGQDLGSEDIYLVDARLAEQGVYGNQPAMFEESGLARFEKRLAKFLTEERHRHHIERFVKAAIKLSRTLQEKIGQRTSALELEAQDLRRTYDSTQKQLAQLDEPKTRIATIVERYRKRAQVEVASSLERKILATQRELPVLLAEYELPSADLASFLHAEQLAKEAGQFCNQTIADQLQRWSGPGGEASQVLEAICSDLMEDVRREIERFEKIYKQFYSGIGAKLGKEGHESIDDWGSRLELIALGNLQSDLQLDEDALGWGGTATSVAGYAITAIVGIAAGLSLGALIPLAIAGALLAQVFRGTAFLPDMIKKWVLDKVIDGDSESAPPRPALTALADLARPKIDKTVDEFMAKLHSSILKAVSTILSEEQKNLREIIGNSERDAGEKSRLMNELEAMERGLKGSCDDLRELLTQAEQVMA